MNKLAIFVEGQGELIFIEALILYIMEINGILHLAKPKRRGQILEIQAAFNNNEYFILIFNCCQDKQVLSSIKVQYNGLVEKGFKKIIGLRDVYPIKESEIPQLRDPNRLPNGICQVLLLLSIMEFEAWILAEHNHFSKMHPALTVELIKKKFGIDVVNDNLSQRMNPAKDLEAIYWLELICYDKTENTMRNIISKLDQVFMKNSVSSKFEDLRNLYHELEIFFSFL